MSFLNYILYKIRLLYLKVGVLLAFLVHLALFLASVAVLLMIVYEFGFNLGQAEQNRLHHIYFWSLCFFFLANILRFIFRFVDIKHEKGFWIDIFITILLLLVIVFRIAYPHPDKHISWLVKVFTSHAMMYFILIFFSILEISKRIFGILNKGISPGLLFAYSFMLIILVGAGLLLLPNSTVHPISIIDALFTSTSAVCVTGLVVLDISSVFTLMGQGIIMGLIQIGGIGVMTFTSFFALSFMGHSSFRNNIILKDLLNDDNLNGIFKTLINIIFTTLGIELIGACIIYFSIDGATELTTANEIFFAVFHAISAFCNAGFSILHGNLFDPLVSHNYMLHTTVAFLIIFGGLGFPIIFNFYKLIGHYFHNKWSQFIGRQKRYVHARIIHVNTRIVIKTTLLLLFFGTVLFFVFEYNNTLKDLSWPGKIATAFFGAVTPRTAGFSTVSMTSMMPATVLLTIVLMWIGASPMSTGGGIKTTTFAIACINLMNMARGKPKMEISKREVSRSSIQRAFAIIVISLLWIGLSVFCIAIAEPHQDLTAVVFECVSALGTVGLSLDLTPTLGTFSKCVLIATMFVGRVGALTILSGILRRRVEQNYSYPQETIMVG